MLRPLFHLLTREPQLAAEHIEAYSLLAAAELRVAGERWTRALVLRLIGAAALGVAVLLAGVALLLWAAIPVAAMAQPALLWVVPLVPAVAGVICWWVVAAATPEAPFSKLRVQWAADRAMFSAASQP